MGSGKRLKKYVRDDRPLKLKSFISSHDLNARRIKLGHGRSLLHYCAEFGSPEMLRCLLRLDCDPSQQDNAGMLPLHHTLYRALSEDLRMARETYVEMVCPLIEVYQMGLDVEDLDRKTGQDLLTSLKQKLKLGLESERLQSKEEEEEIQREWNKKLSREYQFEMEEHQSRYDLNEDFEEDDTRESFSSWTDRMHREYAAKQRSKNPALSVGNPRKRRMEHQAPSGSKGGKNSRSRTGEGDPDENLKNAREKMRQRYKPPPVEASSERFLTRKKLYESKFSRFALQVWTGKSITFGSVPWPCHNQDQLVDVLFCDLKDEESSEYKKYLRAQKVRWHPDKFSQKFGHHLHPDHEVKIMGRVNAFSQTLNAIGA